MSTFSLDSVCNNLEIHMSNWVNNLILSSNELKDFVVESLECICDSTRIEKKVFIYSFIQEAINEIKTSDTVNGIVDEKFVGYIMRKGVDNIDLNTFIKALQIHEIFIKSEKLYLNCSIRASAGGKKRVYFDYTISIEEPDEVTDLYNIVVVVKNVVRDKA